MSRELDRKAKIAYLEKHIFAGLTNLNNGFDADAIKYFSETDFATVLQRAEQHGMGITGIEPWLDGEYYSAAVYEQYDTNPFDRNWYNTAFEKFKQTQEKLQYAATYMLPNHP